MYGWIGIYDGGVARMNDTWTHHFSSLKETQLLYNDPKSFFLGTFAGARFHSVADFFSSYNSYWNNLKWNAYVKLMAVFNSFSFGNYYINVIFYSFLTFFGVVAIFRVMKHHLKAPNPVLIAGCFLIPSFLYWCSGLHKDGLTFLGIAVVIYNFYFYVLRCKAGFKHYFLIGLAFFMLFIFRNHLLVILLPALTAWYLAHRKPAFATKIFLLFYAFAIISFFGLKYIHPSLDFPAIVAEKQHAFNQLGGNTTITISELEPTATGFIQSLPQAITLSVFRPYLNDVYKPLILPAFVELIIIWLLIIASLIVSRKHLKFTPFGLFVFAFCISLLLMIGYTQNNLGATARYRSFIFPLFMPFILATLSSTVFNKYMKIK